MSESLLGNDDYEVRGTRLNMASEGQGVFQDTVVEELGAVVKEGRQILEINGVPLSEQNLELVFQGVMAKVFKNSHYSVRMQFAYAATRELNSNLQLVLPPDYLAEQVPLRGLVAAHRDQLMEALRAELGSFAEDGYAEASFSEEDRVELDKILSMSLEEAEERSLEPSLIEPDIVAETFDHFRALAREKTDSVQQEADTAMNKIGARANGSQRELRDDSTARHELEIVEEYIRTEEIEQAIYYIKSLNDPKTAEELKKVLDDAVIRRARNIIASREENCLGRALDVISFYSSDPYGRNLMRVSLGPELLETARLLIAANQATEAEHYVEASFKGTRLAIKEALNLTHFNHALDMIRHGATEHTVNAYIDEYIHGSENKDYAKRAALSYIYS